MSASIIGGTASTHLVEYENGEVDSVSRDSLHGAICELSMIDPEKPVKASGRALDYDEHDGDGIDVQLEVRPDIMEGKITIGGRADEVYITGSELGQALLAVEEQAISTDTSTATYDQQSGFATSVKTQSVARRMHNSQSSDDSGSDFDQEDVVLSNPNASELYEVYESALRTRVREDVVNPLVSQVPGVEVTDTGAVIEDTYLVTYDAENYLVDDIDTYSVSGSNVVETDGEKQAVGLSFNTEPYGVFTIYGDEYTLSANEQSFLATVEFLKSPSKYLEIDSFETEVYAAIQEAKGEPLHRADIEKIAETAHVTHFVDPKSGLVHRHDIDKHVLRSSFQVASWVVDELTYSSFDHSGLAELAYREKEFRNADRAVFFDGSSNDDDEKWDQINSTEKNAPCPPEVYRRLQSMYGSK